MEADKPEVEYGYIVPSQNDIRFSPWGLQRAAKFVEKPDVNLAGQLVEQGALWNTMIMVFKARQLVEMMAKLSPKVSDQFARILNAIGTPRESPTIESIYRKLEPMTFSKGFLERLTKTDAEILAVLPVLQVSWIDWGSPDRLRLSLALLLKHADQRRAPGSSPKIQQLPNLTVDTKRPLYRLSPARSYHRALSVALCALSLGAIVASADHRSWAQNVASREDAARVLTVENLKVEDGGVSGVVHNRSSRLVRDVQLFIRYTWLWDNEMKPGKDDPGTSVYFPLAESIPPGGQAPFTYRPAAPLGKMAGGHYLTSVSIGGFTEVIPQTK
jgi:hypothetical protein